MNTASAEARPAGVLRHAVRRSVVVSILMIAAGVLAIFAPLAAGFAVNIFVGWLLVFSGAAHFIYAWSARHTGGIISGVLLGILYAFVGGYLLFNPLVGLAALTLALALYLFAEGALEFILSAQLRGLPGSGWLLADGIITVLVAFMVLRTWPWNSEWIIGALVGFSILFSGIARLGLSLSMRKLARSV